MSQLEDRLDRLETRLARLERVFAANGAQQGTQREIPEDTAVETAAAEPADLAPPPVRRASSSVQNTVLDQMRRLAPGAHVVPPDLSVTRILGWTGATALVLAMAYLIRLAVDSGWLTPERQLAAAVLSGFLLIGAGLWLRRADREYASLLPAGGLVVLFLSIYGAHLHYHFIGVGTATGAVILTCLGALWLGRLFESELYSLFAVVGSYSAPFLLEALAASVLDLAIYFSAWSALFCVYAGWLGARRVYLLAAYLALLGFHVILDMNALADWVAAFAFQSFQFVVFLAGAIWFSIRHARPLSREEAVAHLPLLLLFYALQYPLLEANLPLWAPWIALASAALLLLAYLVARAWLDVAPEAGGLLVAAYTALVLFHAGYMELIPPELAPWVGLALLPALAAYHRLVGAGATVLWPYQMLIGVVFAINYLRVLLDTDVGGHADHPLLALFYAAELYAAYYFIRRLDDLRALAAPALYAGHIALLGAAVNILDERLAVSFAWGVVALACLALAFQARDKLLGKSSLLIFAASAGKVLLFDLAEATPLVRIACLVVLGVTLYAGGWMYKKVDAIEGEAAAG